MKPKLNLSLAVVLLVAAIHSSPASAHDSEETPFAMAVIKNDAFGSKVTSGKYEQAISRITRNGRRTPTSFAAQVNLCVAYVKTKSIDKAKSACDAAIAEAKEHESRVANFSRKRSPEALAYRTDLALALSNRGVLMAATGNYDVAERDFRTAIELETSLTAFVANNLERLDNERSSEAVPG